LPRFLDADLVAAGWRELQLLPRMRATIAGLPNLHTAIAALETCWFMRNQLLRDSDWAGMAHSLEIRTPLVDAALYRALAPALCGASPPGKKDMALSPARPLPESVLNRKKTGFEIPVREWIMARLPADEAKSQAENRRLRRWARIVHAAHAA
jgi:asparagine synthase (glutamine-hydrolysing)